MRRDWFAIQKAPTKAERKLIIQLKEETHPKGVPQGGSGWIVGIKLECSFWPGVDPERLGLQQRPGLQRWTTVHYPWPPAPPASFYFVLSSPPKQRPGGPSGRSFCKSTEEPVWRPEQPGEQPWGQMKYTWIYNEASGTPGTWLLLIWEQVLSPLKKNK